MQQRAPLHAIDLCHVLEHWLIFMTDTSTDQSQPRETPLSQRVYLKLVWSTNFTVKPSFWTTSFMIRFKQQSLENTELFLFCLGWNKTFDQKTAEGKHEVEKLAAALSGRSCSVFSWHFRTVAAWGLNCVGLDGEAFSRVPPHHVAMLHVSTATSIFWTTGIPLSPLEEVNVGKAKVWIKWRKLQPSFSQRAEGQPEQTESV